MARPPPASTTISGHSGQSRNTSPGRRGAAATAAPPNTVPPPPDTRKPEPGEPSRDIGRPATDGRSAATHASSRYPVARAPRDAGDAPWLSTASPTTNAARRRQPPLPGRFPRHAGSSIAPCSPLLINSSRARSEPKDVGGPDGPCRRRRHCDERSAASATAAHRPRPKRSWPRFAQPPRRHESTVACLRSRAPFGVEATMGQPDQPNVAAGA